MSHLNSIYFGIHKDYLKNHSLAYNIIVVPNLKCLYETNIKEFLNIPENKSGSYKELRKFCKEKQIFLIVINFVYCIITQDKKQQELLHRVSQNSDYYKTFIIYLNKLEHQSKYKFNLLVWIDELNNEDSVNIFCSRTWDLFEK